jgi:hypothetical protein
MPSSGMLCGLTVVRTYVSEELSASIIRVIIGELETMYAVTSKVVRSSPIIFALMMEALLSSEPSVLTRATRRKIPEDGILHECV